MDVAQYNTLVAAAGDSNPSGAWSGAPSLAASTVAMTNSSGHAVFVDITGGTVTSIKVDGVATGITAGTVRLRKGQTLSITYSVAPTVAWYFDAPLGWTPAGAWSGAPSVAATTVPMTNTSGYPVTAHVIPNGATITVIKVDGVTTGLITGSFRLRRGSTLTLTYTGGTPAIAWVYA